MQLANEKNHSGSLDYLSISNGNQNASVTSIHLVLVVGNDSQAIHSTCSHLFFSSSFLLSNHKIIERTECTTSNIYIHFEVSLCLKTQFSFLGFVKFTLFWKICYSISHFNLIFDAHHFKRCLVY